MAGCWNTDIILIECKYWTSLLVVWWQLLYHNPNSESETNCCVNLISVTSSPHTFITNVILCWQHYKTNLISIFNNRAKGQKSDKTKMSPVHSQAPQGPPGFPGTPTIYRNIIIIIKNTHFLNILQNFKNAYCFLSSL